ncbi:MAG: adenosine kinase [Gammaproteobacteria bacterium]|nr:adenosine kinase [Gammaproteobacteria bacterium]
MKSQYDVFSLGNALVDIELEVTPQELERLSIEKGVMTLVELERHDYLLEELVGKAHHRASGGSAANSIFALAQLGGRGYHCCKVAQDEAGQFYASDLNDAGVDNNIAQLENNNGTTGKCLVMVTPDADRTMNTYLGISSEQQPQDLDLTALGNSQYLYIEGYLVTSESNHQSALAAKKHADEQGVKVAYTLSDPNMVRFFKPQIEQILANGVELLFANEDEALEFTQKDSVLLALKELQAHAKQVVITLGAKGAVYFDGEQTHHIEPFEVEAIDTNGAGDMFAGAFLYGLTQGYSAQKCGQLASFASSFLVTQFGPRLKGEAVKVIQNFNQKLQNP